MNILDNIYATLFKPHTAFPDLVNREYLAGSFLIVALVAILSAFRNAISLDAAGLSLGILVIISMGSYFLLWIFSSLFLTFTADFLGGTGKITDTMTGLAYALLPLIFISPLYVLTNTMGEPGQNLFPLLQWLIYLWTVALIILSLKYTHRFHITQAILSVVSIFGLIIIFVGGTMLMSVLGIILTVRLFS